MGANRYNANVNGARNDELSVKLDGMSNMDSGVNMCCSTWVNPDTIAEFRVVTNAATAEFGHAGGPMISVVTKGGSKQFHGSAYGFLRNESLDSNTFTTNYNGTRKPTYRYNTTGFTVGGPAYIPHHFNAEKNKLFFFASEEYQQQYIGTNTNNKTTPTAAQRLLQRIPVNGMAIAEQTSEKACWLLFADEEGLCREISNELKETGIPVFLITKGREFKREDPWVCS